MTPDSLARALETEQRARRERWQVITALAGSGTMDSDEIALSVVASGLADYGVVAAHTSALHDTAAANRALAAAERGLDCDYEARPAPHHAEPGCYIGAVLVRKQRSTWETTPEAVAELLAALASADLTSPLPTEDAEALAVEIDFAGIPIAAAIARQAGAVSSQSSTR